MLIVPLMHSLHFVLLSKEKKNFFLIEIVSSFSLQGNYSIKHFSDPREVELCHYTGKVRDRPGSWAALSTCEGDVRGVVFDGRELHHVHPEEGGEELHWVYRHNDHHMVADAASNRMKRSVSNEKDRFLSGGADRASASSSPILGPWNANRRSRFVELLLVVDNREFIEHGRDLPKVLRFCKDVANVMNALYSPLDIYIALVGVVVWTEHDEITLSPSGDTTLTNFLHYRRERLVKDHPNDNAQLLTGVTFDGGVVGKALKGPMCTFEFSGGVNMWHSDVVGLVATTVAHEMGHNFGMEHDTEDCECPDDRCIMAPASSTLKPTFWSSCSLEYLALAFEHGMDYCLRNRPTALFDSPTCGNGFVEEGEQCDCGLPKHCDNPCCNPTTCTLHANATCATGKCCDLATCHPKQPGATCRLAEHECDLPEFCTGESEHCPSDVFKVDGTSCKVGRSFCYQGTCRTHSDQCKLLWGPSGKKSDDQCYEQNLKGSRHGNCGYNRLNNSYVNCRPADVRCGMLHCSHLNERLEFGMESVSILSHSFINSGGRIIPCRSALVDLGLNDKDPGLAPEGARCGDGMLCVNQKCMAVGELKVGPASCPNGCNGRGTCNSFGHCHCDVGYSPPDCLSSGPGGSLDSGPASGPGESSSVAEILVAVFLAVVFLIFLIVLLVFLRSRGDLQRLVEKAKSSPTTTAADAEKRRQRLDISGPCSVSVNGNGAAAGGGGSGGSSPTHALLPRVDTSTTVASGSQARKESTAEAPGSGDEGGEVAVVDGKSFWGGFGRQKKHSASDLEGGGGGREKLGFVQSLARSITFPSSIKAREKAARYEIKVEKQQPKGEEDSGVSSPLGDQNGKENDGVDAEVKGKDAAAACYKEAVSITEAGSPTRPPRPQKPPTPKRPVSTSLASPDQPDFKSNPKLAFPHSSSFTSSGALRSPYLPSSKLAFNTSHISKGAKAAATTAAAAATTATFATTSTTATTASLPTPSALPTKPQPPPVAKKPVIVTATTTSSVTSTTSQIVSPVMASAKPLQSPFFKKSTAAATTAAPAITTTTSAIDTTTTATSSMSLEAKESDSKKVPPPQTLTKTSTLPTSLSYAASGAHMSKSSTLPLNATSPTGQQPARSRPEISKPVLQTATDSAVSLIEKAPSTGVSQSSILSREKKDRAAGSRGVVFCDPLTLPSPTNPNNPPIIHQPHLQPHLPPVTAAPTRPASTSVPEAAVSKATSATIVTPTWTTQSQPLSSDAVICHIDEEDSKAVPAAAAPIASPDRESEPRTSPNPPSTSTLTHGGSAAAPSGRSSFRGLEISAPILQSSVNIKTKLIPVCAPAPSEPTSSSPRSSSPAAGSTTSSITSPIPTRTAPPPPIAPRGRPRTPGTRLTSQKSFSGPSTTTSSSGALPKQSSLDERSTPPLEAAATAAAAAAPAPPRPHKVSRRVPVPWLRGKQSKETEQQPKKEETSFSGDKPVPEARSSSYFSSKNRPASIATTRPIRPSAPPPMPPPDRVSPSPTLQQQQQHSTRPAAAKDKEHIYDTIKESPSPEKEVRKVSTSSSDRAKSSAPERPSAIDLASPEDAEFCTPTASPLFARKGQRSPDAVSTASSSEGDFMKEILGELVTGKTEKEGDEIYSTLTRKKKAGKK